MEFTTTADVRISDPVRFMKQLCRHFGHKLETTIDDAGSTVEFTGAHVELVPVGDVLRMHVTAASIQEAERFAGVVDRHLVKFAFRETLDIAWSEPAERATTPG